MSELERCWPGGPRHDWVPFGSADSWTCDRCGAVDSDD